MHRAIGGKPVHACQLLAVQVGVRPITTIEGLGKGDSLDSVQQAFLENDGGQCGFCTPGFVMAARALLAINPNPSEDDIRQALSGNLCRCNAYRRILQSVREAAWLSRASGGT